MEKARQTGQVIIKGFLICFSINLLLFFTFLILLLLPISGEALLPVTYVYNIIQLFLVIFFAYGLCKRQNLKLPYKPSKYSRTIWEFLFPCGVAALLLFVLLLCYDKSNPWSSYSVQRLWDEQKQQPYFYGEYYSCKNVSNFYYALARKYFESIRFLRNIPARLQVQMAKLSLPDLHRILDKQTFCNCNAVADMV